MLLYVYRWDYVEHTILGSTPQGLIKVRGFVPWKYIKGKRYLFKTLQGSKPTRVDKVPGKHKDALLQFLSSRHLSQTGWVEVPDWHCNADQVNPIDSKELPELHIISFDIEAYSSKNQFPDPSLPEDAIICIGTVSSQYGPKTFVGEESAMVYSFYQYLLSAHLVVGYNTHGFDWRYILERHGLPVSKDRTWVWEKSVWSSSACNKVDVSYPSSPGVLVVDLYHYCKRTFKIDDYRLNTVANYFGITQGKFEMPYQDLWRGWEQGELDSIIRYCEQDCQLVLEILQRCNMVHGLLALAQVT